MEALRWGWELKYNRDDLERGYGWEVYVETAETRHVRATTVCKPHKHALRNAKAALRRLRHKIAGTQPRRRLSLDASIWASELGIPQ